MQLVFYKCSRCHTDYSPIVDMETLRVFCGNAECDRYVLGKAGDGLKELSEAWNGKKGNKYHAKKVERFGLKFDSEAELKRYIELQLLHDAGEIKILELQPKFTLLPEFKTKKGKKIRAITYKADFAYFLRDNTRVVEEVKGFETRDFILRAKLFQYMFPDIVYKVFINGKESERY